MVGLKDVEISLKGYRIAKVMCVDDANIGLKDVRIVDVVQVIFFLWQLCKRFIANFELLLVA